MHLITRLYGNYEHEGNVSDAALDVAKVPQLHDLRIFEGIVGPSGDYIASSNKIT